jgi:Pathogenicity locus
MPKKKVVRSGKAVPRDRETIREFEELPNVGAATAGDFRVLGLARPQDLIGQDPFALYEELCRRTNVRHDPCCIDVFMAAVDFMGGAPARPWWTYTPERKRRRADALAQATQSAS